MNWHNYRVKQRSANGNNADSGHSSGAFALDLFKNRHELSMDDSLLIAIGFACAFIVALIVVRTVLDFVSRNGFAFFAWWRIIVGTAGLAGLYAFG